MPLNKQFVSAKIVKKNDNAYVLEITYCWYYLMNYTETFVEGTMNEAKSRLLKERSHDHVVYIDIDGRDKTLFNDI